MARIRCRGHGACRHRWRSHSQSATLTSPGAASELGAHRAFRVGGERTPLLDGALQLSLARIATAEEDWDTAEAAARGALATWSRVGAPYEAAVARIALGMAYEHKGDRSRARTEYEAAKATFERLGAVLDVQRTMELLGEAAATHRTFVFTDIVDSTKLLEALGQEKWKKLLDRHDALLTEAIRHQRGEVIKHTGDGFFAAFHAPASAVEAAVQIQRALEDEIFAVRIGIHSGEALERGNDYTGRGVNVAARIGAVGGAGGDPRLRRNARRHKQPVHDSRSRVRPSSGLRRGRADRGGRLPQGIAPSDPPASLRIRHLRISDPKMG